MGCIIYRGMEKGLTVWFTGLSSSGKTTISKLAAAQLRSKGWRVEVLDGDAIRATLCRDLGFTRPDREENLRRIAFVAELLRRNGVIVLVAAISPYQSIRDEIRGQSSRFVEVYVNAPLAVCEKRDVKGLYRKARNHELKNVTGIDDLYEPPLNPEVECRTDQESIDESVEKVTQFILRSLSLQEP
jgi:adenylylsulfate kinase